MRAEAEAAEQLQPLRDQEAAKGAVLHRFKIEQENLEREAQRTAERRRELEARVEQLTRDRAREEALIAEAKETLARLEGEMESLANTDKLAAEFEQKALAAYDEADDRPQGRRGAARRAHHGRRRGARAPPEHRGAAARAPGARAKLERQLDGARSADARDRRPRAGCLQAQGRRRGRPAADGRHRRHRGSRPSPPRRPCRPLPPTPSAKSELAAEVGLAAGQLRTEVETLAKLLKPAGDSGLPPVLDHIKVASGYEMALAAALGDDLDAPAAAEAPVHWRSMPRRARPRPAGRRRAAGGARRRLRRSWRGGSSRSASCAARGRRAAAASAQAGPASGLGARATCGAGTASSPPRRAPSPRPAACRSAAGSGCLPARRTCSAAPPRRRAAQSEEAAERLRGAQGEERRLRQLWRDCQSRARADARDADRHGAAGARDRGQARRRRRRQGAHAGGAARGARAARRDRGRRAGARRHGGAGSRARRRAESRRPSCASRVSEAKTELITLEREHRARTERQAAIAAERERWKTRSAGAEQQIATLRAAHRRGQGRDRASLPACPPWSSSSARSS